MFIAITIVIVSVIAIAIAATLFELPRDGHRRVPTDWSRLP